MAEDQTNRSCTDSFQLLPEVIKGDFNKARCVLRQHFEFKSHQGQYQAELQTRKKKKEKKEDWADLADDLGRLADQAYPELQVEARERLDIDHYLRQLKHP